MNTRLTPGTRGQKCRNLASMRATAETRRRGQVGDWQGTNRGQIYRLRLKNSLIFLFHAPFSFVLSPRFLCWLPTHFAGIEREGCSLGMSHSAAGAVDNFIRMPNLSIAYFLGSVHNFRKCMYLLNIPDSVQKVTHNAHFIQRALC